MYRHLRAPASRGGFYHPLDARAAAAGTMPPPGAHARGRYGRLTRSLCTTDILPVDLNALLYQFERHIATFERAGDTSTHRRRAGLFSKPRRAGDAIG